MLWHQASHTCIEEGKSFRLIPLTSCAQLWNCKERRKKLKDARITVGIFFSSLPNWPQRRSGSLSVCEAGRKKGRKEDETCTRDRVWFSPLFSPLQQALRKFKDWSAKQRVHVMLCLRSVMPRPIGGVTYELRRVMIKYSSKNKITNRSFILLGTLNV